MKEIIRKICKQIETKTQIKNTKLLDNELRKIILTRNK